MAFFFCLHMIFVLCGAGEEFRGIEGWTSEL